MIGIFGGTFNPIHLAHLVIAEEVRIACDLSKVIFIPTFRPPHKNSEQLIEAAHRLNMVKLAIADNPYFECSDIELTRKGISYTVETLRLLAVNNPSADYALIIGGDSLLELHTWERVEEILTRCHVIATNRPGTTKVNVDSLTKLAALLVNKELLTKIKLQPTALLEISATNIRERVSRGISIKYLVAETVIEYIKQHHLYGAI